MDFLIALGIAIALTPLARRVGLASGVVDTPDGRELKIHAAPVPLLGGTAVTAAVLVAAALDGDHLPAALVAGVLCGLATGFVDDVRPLPVWPRLLMQVAAGAALAAAGLRLGVHGALGVAGVVALCAILTNAVNMIDGQDLLAGGVAMIAALGLGGLAVLDGRSRSSLAFATAGALAAFLLWNRPPAKIFLGNGGAYAVGVLLAASAASVAAAGLRSVLAAGACLAVPGLEIAFTAARRMAHRTPLGAGDRGHSYDELARKVGRPRTAAWFCAAQAAAVGSSFAIRVLPTVAAGSVLALEAAAAAVWFFGVGSRRRDLVRSS